MRKTLYVKSEDEELFRQVEGENLSALVAKLLRRYLSEREKERSGLKEFSFFNGLTRYRFWGRKLWPLEEEDVDCPEVEEAVRRNPFESDHYLEYSVFLTRRGKLVLLIHDQSERVTDVEKFESAQDLLTSCGLDASSSFARYLAYVSGNPETVDLDV